MRVKKSVVRLNLFVPVFFLFLSVFSNNEVFAFGEVAVYRLFSPPEQKHLFTISKTERDNLKASNAWNIEGVGWCAYSEQNRPPAARPVFRFYNTKTNQHVFTIKNAERNHLSFIKEWRYEGVAWYAFIPEQRPPDTVPVYRLKSKTTGKYLFTASTKEKYQLMMTPDWEFHEIAWYAYTNICAY